MSGLFVKFKITTSILVVLLSIMSFAAIVADNDGSAFVTKAEFEALKKEFVEQVDNYNLSIDEKIDGAIAAYLAGIKVSETGFTPCYSEGVQWSIGPFDRPRYKNGKTLVNLYDKTRYYNASSTISTEQTTIQNWGAYWDQKKELNSDGQSGEFKTVWRFTDLILDDVYDFDADGNLVTNPAAEFKGVYNNSAHYYSFMKVPLTNSTYKALYTDYADYNTLYGGLSLRTKPTEGWIDNPIIDFRPGTNPVKNKSISNPQISNQTSFLNGTRNAYSLKKGSRLEWDENVTAFGPISYNCFNKEQNDADYGPGYRNKGIRDEILYEVVNLENGSSMSKLDGTWNALYYNFPDVEFYGRNPWNLSASVFKENALGKIRMNNFNTSTSYRYSNTKEFKLQLGRGYQNNNSAWTVDYKYYYQPDVKFTGISNWNQVGKEMDISLSNYIKNKSSQTAIIKSKSKELLSLAAGLPVCTLYGKTTTTITGTFRATPSYVWKDNRNVFNKSVIDNKNVYVVYAKKTPFDKTKMPDEETELLNISNNDTENSHAKFKNCLIVRDGKLNIELNNTSTGDAILFLKWEKLSNWNEGRTARKTADATNYDVHVEGSNTNTIALPKWTYFGGGYLELPKEFMYATNY